MESPSVRGFCSVQTSLLGGRRKRFRSCHNQAHSRIRERATQSSNKRVRGVVLQAPADNVKEW
jgi:hypothetical protein